MATPPIEQCEESEHHALECLEGDLALVRRVTQLHLRGDREEWGALAAFRWGRARALSFVSLHASLSNLLQRGACSVLCFFCLLHTLVLF